jgi:hypothetical protein
MLGQAVMNSERMIPANVSSVNKAKKRVRLRNMKSPSHFFFFFMTDTPALPVGTFLTPASFATLSIFCRLALKLKTRIRRTAGRHGRTA